MDPPECSGHSHDHDHGDSEDGLGLSVRPYVDFTKVQCFNEDVAGSGKAVIKLYEDRHSEVPSLLSPAGDPELLLIIPFTEAVTIQAIAIRSSSSRSDAAAPRKVRLFTNREDLDFETARELPAQQELELLPPNHFVEGTIDYPMRPAGRFQNISSISIYIVNNYDEDEDAPTEITFIGLKGKGTNMKRRAVETVYEAQGMPKDHKVPDEFTGRNVL
jgi:hypothetical protein